MRPSERHVGGQSSQGGLTHHTFQVADLVVRLVQQLVLIALLLQQEQRFAKQHNGRTFERGSAAEWPFWILATCDPINQMQNDMVNK